MKRIIIKKNNEIRLVFPFTKNTMFFVSLNDNLNVTFINGNQVAGTTCSTKEEAIKLLYKIYKFSTNIFKRTLVIKEASPEPLVENNQIQSIPLNSSNSKKSKKNSLKKMNIIDLAEVKVDESIQDIKIE